MTSETSDATFESYRVAASDGFALGVSRVGRVGDARGVVVVNCAMAVPQRFYRAYASELAQAGYCVVTYDYRGVGESRPLPLAGFQATARQWAERDARAVLHHARELARDRPVLTVGHSFGGQLAGIIDEARDVQGALMVGAQLGYVRHFSPAMRARMLFGFRLSFPALDKIWGYVPGRFGLGEDLPSGVVEEWARWCLSPGYLLDHVPEARRRFAHFDKPTLFYSFTDDQYAPSAAVAALTQALIDAPLTHRRFAPGELDAAHVGHFGFFRPERRELWIESVRFFDAIVEGRPSPLRSRLPSDLEIGTEDVLMDLEYGRA
ncbi:MAG: alpha/beta fold hydrolase [Polyangiaceae bacterium]